MNADIQIPMVVVALPSEMRHALGAVDDSERVPMGPWVRWRATLDDQPVSLVLSGIGMVNAGAALSRALFEIAPSMILNYGCAGAHQARINPGDVVIGTSYVHHRAVTVLPTGVEKYGGTPVSPEDSSHFAAEFRADPQLLAAARDVAVDWSVEPWPRSKPGQVPEVHAGPLTSSDAWTQATDLIDRIFTEHGTFCEDMEAAALAQIASMHGVPFLAVKDISNNEYHSASDYAESGWPTLDAVRTEVGMRSFALVRRILQQHRP